MAVALNSQLPLFTPAALLPYKEFTVNQHRYPQGTHEYRTFYGYISSLSTCGFLLLGHSFLSSKVLSFNATFMAVHLLTIFQP